MRVRNAVQEIIAYPKQPESGIRMDLNMNIVLPPPVKKILHMIPHEIISEYPAQESHHLQEALARRFSVTPEQVITGSGSSQIIDLAIRTFAGRGTRLNLVSPGFSMYDFFAKLNSARIRHFNLNEKDFSLNWDMLIRSPGVCLIASPNNPTGNTFDLEGMMKCVETCEKKGYAFILDEAYAEYARQNIALRVNEFSNLVVLRTFSKAYGIPGARVGYAIASSGSAEYLRKVRPPFALNALSEYIAIKMLNEKEYLEKVVSLTERERGFLADELIQLGFHVYPSKANFLLIRTPAGVNSTILCQYLARNGIMIKDFSGTKMLGNCVRVTVGSRKINTRFLSLVRKFVETH